AIDDAMLRLRDLPYEDLGFAKVDHHRALRTGFPEVIYCPGKTHEQVLAIADRLLQRSSKVLATRADANTAQALLTAHPPGPYPNAARIVSIPGVPSVPPVPTVNSQGFVLVAAAGTADLPVAEEAAVTASEMGSPVERLYDVGVAGLHRLLDKKEL